MIMCRIKSSKRQTTFLMRSATLYIIVLAMMPMFGLARSEGTSTTTKEDTTTLRAGKSLTSRDTATVRANIKPAPTAGKDNIAKNSGNGATGTDVIDQSRMNKGLNINPLDAINGKAAGVTVTTGENRMAMINSVRVRGTTSLTGGNDPLVIIDGVYSDLSTLSSIYPADIESFAILKNAAETAPYGSRGASGVIQVTTKKGSGGRFHLQYDGNVSFESVYKNIHMLSGPQYIATANALGLYANNGGYNTNFPDAITRTGFFTNHHIAFSGGTDEQNYRASIGVQDHNMMIKSNSAKNFAAKLDFLQKAFDDRLTIEMGLFGSSQSNKYIFDEQKLFYSAASQNPTFPNHMNASGGWDKNSTASQINPPGALLKEKNDERNQNFGSHLKLVADLGLDLTLTAFGAYTYNSDENARFAPTWVWAQGQAWRGEQKQQTWLGNLQLDWAHTWGNAHALNLTALSEYEQTRTRSFNTSVKGFTTNALNYENISGAATSGYGQYGSAFDNPKLLSFMVGAEYTLLGRYTLTASARLDGSSMVASSNRWGIFPSVSAAWDMMKERWMQKQRILSRLKLRTGYGLTGNLGAISSYNSLNRLAPVGVVPWNGAASVTYATARNVNPDLKWETRGTYNIGADLGFWNDRLILTMEYYYSRTWDMLYQYDVPVPPFSYDKMLANLGKMSNQGFEIGASVTPVQKKDMELNISMNLSFQKNKLLSLSGRWRGMQLTAADITSIGSLNGAGFHGGNNNIVYQIVGKSLGVFYLPHCTGLTQNADGSYSYAIVDLDQNGIVNIEDGGDRYIAGQATPKAFVGANISFRYKDFDITLQMNGAFGHKIYNGTSLTYMNMGSFPDYNVMKAAPKKNIKDQTATDYWLHRGDYLNFDYLTIGWNIPLSPKVKYLSSLRVSLSVNNICTLTAYKGLTPMINSSVVDNTLGIDDKRSYPPYRTFSLGLSVGF